MLNLPLTVVLLVVACLTAAGMAVRSVSRIWLRHWAERSLRGATAAFTYLERPQRLLGTAAAGVTAALVVGGLLIGMGASGANLAWRVAGFAALCLLFGQILPRAIARRFATRVVPVLVPTLRAVEAAADPLLGLGRRLVSRWTPAAMPVAGAPDRDSIEHLLREGELEGVGERGEIEIISGVVAFGSKRVADVMRQREEIFALPASMPPHERAERIAQSAYSRVPIYDGSLDKIVGMVHAFDVLKAGAEEMPPLRAVAFTTPDVRCNDLLYRLLRERRHLTIVHDASGHTLGLATLEDLLEELVGDIRDEHDEPEPPASPSR